MKELWESIIYLIYLTNKGDENHPFIIQIKQMYSRCDIIVLIRKEVYHEVNFYT